MKMQGKETVIKFYKTMAIPVVTYSPEIWILIMKKAEIKDRKRRC
jgi:hypothetical protein